MAINSIRQRMARVGQGGSAVNHKAKRYLVVGILGGTLLLALAVGIATRQGSGAQAVADAPTAGLPGKAAVGAPFRLSPPNEVDAGSTVAIPASSASMVYRVSAPNETDPDGTFFSGAAPTSSPPYRVSPPNEQEPAGP